MERHEAEVWARCVELAALVPGNPLGAVTDRRGAVPLPALTTVDSSEFNRVGALGLEAPVTATAVERIAQFYLDRGQDHFRVEVVPQALSPDLAGILGLVGLHPVPETVTKVWRCFDARDGAGAAGADDSAHSADVRLLTSEHAEQVAALNVRAWGAWGAPVSLGPWFGASVGAEGFAHYGVFVDDRLVCTGAMAISGDLAWIGFDATHPRHQSQQLRRAVTRRRIGDAVAAGCRVVHAEADSSRLTSRSRLLDTHYDRMLFVHGTARPS